MLMLENNHSETNAVLVDGQRCFPPIRLADWFRNVEDYIVEDLRAEYKQSALALMDAPAVKAPSSSSAQLPALPPPPAVEVPAPAAAATVPHALAEKAEDVDEGEESFDMVPAEEGLTAAPADENHE